jgi:predicted nucleic acid-binding protein
MKAGVLMDAGPIVAFLYRREQDHDWAVEQFEALSLPFVSCEPAISEACFLVARNGQPPTAVIDMLKRGIVRVGIQLQDELAAIDALMARYANVPMSLAGACLVRMAEMTGLPICTLDSDFMIYRAHGRRPIEVICPTPRHLHEP